MREDTRGFFQLDQSPAAPAASSSLTVIFPNAMTAVKVSSGGEYVSVDEEGGGGGGGGGGGMSVLKRRFHELPASHAVHSAFPARQGDVHHSLLLPPPQDRSSYPLKLVSGYAKYIHLCMS